jgi:hypothetical protein
MEIFAMFKIPNTKLRNSNCDQGNVFALNLLLSMSIIGNQEQNICFEPCPYLHA